MHEYAVPPRSHSIPEGQYPSKLRRAATVAFSTASQASIFLRPAHPLRAEIVGKRIDPFSGMRISAPRRFGHAENAEGAWLECESLVFLTVAFDSACTMIA